MIRIREVACGEDPAVFDAAAALYNRGQHKGPADKIDPTDARYGLLGGVHMGRDGDWYRRQLQMPGAVLVVAELDAVQIGHSLFFTDQFPTFASDLEWMRQMPGVQKLAYGYLTIVHPDHRGAAHGQQVSLLLVKRRSEILVARGCNVLGTEVFVSPQPNLPSLNFHRAQGAVCVGGVGTHTIPEEVGSGTIIYSQWAKAMPGWKVVPGSHRTFSIVPE